MKPIGGILCSWSKTRKKMGNDLARPAELPGSLEPVTNFAINIKQPDKLHLVTAWFLFVNSLKIYPKIKHAKRTNSVLSAGTLWPTRRSAGDQGAGVPAECTGIYVRCAGIHVRCTCIHQQCIGMHVQFKGIHVRCTSIHSRCIGILYSVQVFRYGVQVFIYIVQVFKYGV